MKKTKNKKKLQLNKETVRVLTDELANVAGGQPRNYPCTGGLSGCGASDCPSCMNDCA